ncbi:MAG: hypothetical protein HDT21_12485 [Ruminococcus sp.]|nr:hypothetical protein [Ruminococcus sp.]
MAVLDIDKVFSVFKLFYCEEDADSFLPAAELAAEYTGRRIIGDENAGDPRLYYLAAAETLCRVLEIKSARERLSLTRTGAVSAESDYPRRIECAEKLYRSYEALCVGIIRDDGFLFLRTD